jgi:hypothetical protein
MTVTESGESSEIRWEAYLENADELTEENVKDEGPFATVAFSDSDGEIRKLMVNYNSGSLKASPRYDPPISVTDGMLSEEDRKRIIAASK